MEAEHCALEDADIPFTARNYGTTTTSRIEWCFVARPKDLSLLGARLNALGLPAGRWPSHDERSVMRYDEYMRSATGVGLQAQLEAEGEQALSEPEYVGLRAHTRPLVEPYSSP